MTARLLDGRPLAARIRSEVEGRAKLFRARYGRPPGIDVVRIGEDAASRVYTVQKEKASNDVGLRGRVHAFSADTDLESLDALIDSLNADDSVDAILLQLPLPPQIPVFEALSRVLVSKDVEGFHPFNVGLRSLRQKAVLPCTAVACLRLLEDAGVVLRGLDALVIGCSAIVGKPVSDLLLQAGATVTIAHSETRELAAHVSRADVLVVAAGSPGLVRGAWLKPGAIVVDVGIHRVTDESGKGRVVGDVEFEEAKLRASMISPVPGGVGPVTTAVLLENAVTLAEQRMRLYEQENPPSRVYSGDLSAR